MVWRRNCTFAPDWGYLRALERGLRGPDPRTEPPGRRASGCNRLACPPTPALNGATPGEVVTHNVIRFLKVVDEQAASVDSGD